MAESDPGRRLISPSTQRSQNVNASGSGSIQSHQRYLKGQDCCGFAQMHPNIKWRVWRLVLALPLRVLPTVFCRNQIGYALPLRSPHLELRGETKNTGVGTGVRHASEEIAAKLSKAAVAGKMQTEIAQTLGISAR